ncbi:response regulator [Clostridium sp.]|uniref:response regulator transcription factor n=1 Tax=Clostridium sp. TaxID=1506 RepID=UPI002FC97ACD
MEGEMLRVMIVDDMKVFRTQIKKIGLWGETSGFHIVEEAEDGQEALEKLLKEPVDLIITDISMPRINGIELLKEIQERGLSSCVVFLSEHSEFNLAKQAIQNGIFDYLLKPVNKEELEQLLIRVKKYIEEKIKTQKTLATLDDKLMSSIELYCPENQLRLIVEGVCKGDQNLVDYIRTIIEDTYVDLDKNIKKVTFILERVYNKILCNVKTQHKWIEEFVDENFITDISLTQHSDIDVISEIILQNIEFLVLTIKKFILTSKKFPLIKELCNYIINNIETEISMSKISDTFFLTKNYIGEVFKQETGVTLGEYINMVKMERAKALIAQGNLRSYEIANRLCYNNAEYFAKLFKKYTGLSPIEFKNQI